MRILVFSDSLSLPRSQPETCLHEQTWPELLRKQGHEVCLSAIGGATVQDLLKQTFYFQDRRYFDLVVVQCGIVDCAPRFAKRWELKILQALGKVGKCVIRLLNRKSVRNLRKLTYTSEKAFCDGIQRLENAFDAPVVFVEILPATSSYETQLPGVTKNIEAFNAILRSHRHISMKDIPETGIMSDHHHLSSEGHAYLVKNILNQWS
ncbi:MAG: SGNH/GDSL hydrolase family protein [Bacteroidetes bacterium]|nr:SGNH/GDSL hydrolase family protein [Bacteroidota bacterium]MBM3424657.1 SGNH/GDSL hydrolase family protein [Bacteroidota bacterium]